MEPHNGKIKQFLKSLTARTVIIAVCATAAVVLVFQAGMIVGFHKAVFDRSFDQHYVENFGPLTKGPFGPMPGQFPNAHGTVGRIIQVSLPTFIVEGPDKIEKVVTVSGSTRIRELRNDIPATSLAADEFVVVIGEPNANGQIDAKLIRVLPPNQ